MKFRAENNEWHHGFIYISVLAYVKYKDNKFNPYKKK